MLIRIVTTRAAIPRTGEGIAFIHGEIEPKIAEMDGNKGFAMVVDHSSGRYLSIAAWTDPQALGASGRGAPGLIADVARHLQGSEPSVEVFDLALASVVKPVRIGYWGRLTRFGVPVGDLDRAEQKYRQLALAWFERYDGHAVTIVFVDRVEGVLGSIFWFDSVHALRGSASRTQEMRDLLVQEVPTVRVDEDVEVQAIIAEMGDLTSTV